MIPVPLIISLGVAITALVIVVPVLLRTQVKARSGEFYLFNREKGVENGKGDNLVDMVIHKTGGYVVRPDTTIHARYGRVLMERGSESWRRKIRPVSLLVAGQSAAIKILNDGAFEIDPLTVLEFDQRERQAAEIAVSEAAVRAGSSDFVAKVMALSAGVLVLPVIGLIVVAVTNKA